MNQARIQFIFAVLVALLLPVLTGSGTLASEILIFALAAAGCNLLLGFTGLLSFGQGVFFGLGSYAIGLVLIHTGIPTLLGLAISSTIGGLAAIIIGTLSIRRQGVYFVMLTLAFAQLFYFLAYSFPAITGGDNGLIGFSRSSIGSFAITSSWSYYGLVAILFLIVFGVLLRIASSTFGRTLLAIRDNEARAQAIGFPVRVFKIAAFAVSGAVTGLAGGLHALLIGIAPLSNIDYHMSESLLIMTIVGGTGSLFGSVIGAGAYLIVSDLLSSLWPRWLFFVGALLIALALFSQGGVWGLLEYFVARIRRSDQTTVANTLGGKS